MTDVTKQTRGSMEHGPVQTAEIGQGCGCSDMNEGDTVLAL